MRQNSRCRKILNALRQELLKDFKCDVVIIEGDFNLVLDLDIDKKKAVSLKHIQNH